MNGAQALLKTLADAGVEICFTNPGTSEMYFVSAMGQTDAIHPILCLYEGVATGAADGYGRMADKPAITLLHMGCGLSNSMANLHNAKKAHVPVVNIIGDHADYHLQYDSPLKSDVPAHARICSDWVKVSKSADDMVASGALAVQASLQGSGKVATLIAPANHAWEKTNTVVPPRSSVPTEPVPAATVEEIARTLTNGKSSALILGGRALREEALAAAGRIADATGVRLLHETFPARMQRGAGRVKVDRIPYFPEQVVELLAEYDQLILVGAESPVAFFAYPEKRVWLAPDGCEIKTLATPDQDMQAALKALAERLNAAPEPGQTQPRTETPPSNAELTPEGIGRSLCLLLPENAIVSDESATCGLELYISTQGAAPHDWLMLTGGAIGQGLPLSLGAATACPDRKVVALQADGSAMYTLQALWTMAREKADVTVVLLNNRGYAILNIELARTGAVSPTEKTLSLLNLKNPCLDWVHIAQGMGVPSSRATTAEAFHRQFKEAMGMKGPRLIEAMVVQGFGNIFE